jgi:DNA-binding NtrC family response regulator
MARVLIVDDDEQDLLLLKTILADAGHEIFLASNGEDALKLYLRNPIEVVVTDIAMPRGDGVELITLLKGLDPSAAIIAVSGQRPHRLDIAQLAGAKKILVKPIEKDGLIDAVEEALNPPDSQAFDPNR